MTAAYQASGTNHGSLAQADTMWILEPVSADILTWLIYCRCISIGIARLAPTKLKLVSTVITNPWH